MLAHWLRMQFALEPHSSNQSNSGSWNSDCQGQLNWVWWQMNSGYCLPSFAEANSEYWQTYLNLDAPRRRQRYCHRCRHPNHFPLPGSHLLDQEKQTNFARMPAMLLEDLELNLMTR